MLRQGSMCSALSEAAAWAYAAGLSLMLASPGRVKQGRETAVGQWESEDGLFKIVLLSDGRIASVDQRSCVKPKRRVKIGTFRLNGNTICCNWLLSAPYDEAISIDGDIMTLGDPGGTHWSYRRTAGEADAARAYQVICDELNRAIIEPARHPEGSSVVPKHLHLHVRAFDQDPSQVGAFAHGAADRSNNTPFVKAACV